jgi:hypothetical protein
MTYRIPEKLVEMLRERRVIPFIGAGFSQNLGYPGWDELLQGIADETYGHKLPFPEVMEAAKHDRLRVAEYYYIKQGRQIGPLRQAISRQFSPKSPLGYGGYVDLVNLSAQRIYTTNFDDSIERAFRELGEEVETIIKATDVAKSSGSRPQVVKYHGDLTDDATLVLTESSYYQRLNFESPLDLKFRADILGRSVLFLGYSFNDLNIRAIWFRLLDMMREVPREEVPISYIVTFTRNEVEEALYRDSGIETIVLDPEGSVESVDYPELFAAFLLDLAIVTRATPQNAWASLTALNRGRQQLTATRGFSGFLRRPTNPSLEWLGGVRIPPQQTELFRRLFEGVSSAESPNSINLAYRWLHEYPGETAPALVLTVAILDAWTRHAVLQTDIEVANLSSFDLGSQALNGIIARCERELNTRHIFGGDDDLFFAARLCVEIADGNFCATNEDKIQAASLVERIEETFPGLTARLSGASLRAIPRIASDYRPSDEQDEAEADIDTELDFGGIGAPGP